MRSKRCATSVGLIVVNVMFLAITAGCRKEPVLEPLPPSEAAAIRAQAWDFHVYPGATELGAQEDLLRRASLALDPAKKEPPALGMWDTDDPLEDVAAFYSGKYQYGEISPSDAPLPDGSKPLAWRSEGDLATDAAAIRPVLERLGMKSDTTAAIGTYRSVTMRGTTGLPRVSIQRPYFDVFEGKVVDRTLVLLVREE